MDLQSVQKHVVDLMFMTHLWCVSNAWSKISCKLILFSFLKSKTFTLFAHIIITNSGFWLHVQQIIIKYAMKHNQNSKIRIFYPWISVFKWAKVCRTKFEFELHFGELIKLILVSYWDFHEPWFTSLLYVRIFFFFFCLFDSCNKQMRFSHVNKWKSFIASPRVIMYGYIESEFFLSFYKCLSKDHITFNFIFFSFSHPIEKRVTNKCIKSWNCKIVNRRRHFIWNVLTLFSIVNFPMDSVKIKWEKKKENKSEIK